MHRVVGLDPSLTATGIAAVDLDEGEVLAWVCVEAKKAPKKAKVPATVDALRRMQTVFDGVRDFLRQHPYPVAIEAQTGGSHGRSGPAQTFGLGTGYAACVLACTSLGRFPTPIMPGVIKTRLGASGYKTPREAKAKVWETCQLFFSTFPDPLSSIARREAVQDAVAVCIASLSTELLGDSAHEQT